MPNAQIANSTRKQELEIFKDISLIVATGIVTLVSAYIGSLIQGLLKEDEESRLDKKVLVNEYIKYLRMLWKMTQDYEKILTEPKLREKLPDQGKKYIISSEKLQIIIDDMPLYGKFSVFEEKNLGITYKKAVDACIKYIIDLQQGKVYDGPDIMRDYKNAINEFDEVYSFVIIAYRDTKEEFVMA